MQLGDKGNALIKSFEKCRLEAYQDEGGVWTIGWGHTPASPGQTCTQAQADAWFLIDVAWAVGIVNALIRVPLTQNEFDALVSFVFNVGAGNFRSSTLRRKLNDGDYAGAAEQFLVWDHVDGAVSDGLKVRREAERALFLS
jgi:lysozyme